MQENRPFTETAFAASTQYDVEYSGRAIGSVGLSLDGTLGGTATAAEDDSIFRLLGTPRISLDETDLIRMAGPDWRHASAIMGGGYSQFTTGFANGGIAAACMLNFRRFARGATINVAGTKIAARGEFSAVTDGFTGGTPAVTNGTLRPTVVTTGDAAPASHLRPKFSQRTVNLGTASDDVQDRIRFDQPVVLAGIMLRALDGKNREDGLIRKVMLEATAGSGGERQLVNSRWGPLRARTAAVAGFSTADVATSEGVVFIPTLDPSKPRGLMELGIADSLTLHFDTNSQAERNYTAITPGGNEEVVITLFAYSIVGGGGTAGASSEKRGNGTARRSPRRR